MNSVFDSLDMSLAVSDEEYRRESDDLREELEKRAARLARDGRYAILVFEGKDAAGKGGAIRRLTAGLPTDLYSVATTAAPGEEERSRHYLWRFWNRLPEPGRIVIFDRSWYGRVLVERVEGFANEREWRQAYREICDMERSFHNAGAYMRKFWLEIDQEEQARRFRARAESPLKHWKITDEDWRNREKWPLYKAAAEEMFARTDLFFSRWQVIPANDKRYARLAALRSVVELLRG